MGDPGIARVPPSAQRLEAAATASGEAATDLVSADLTQVVLDTAEWLHPLGGRLHGRIRYPSHLARTFHRLKSRTC